MSFILIKTSLLALTVGLNFSAADIIIREETGPGSFYTKTEELSG